MGWWSGWGRKEGKEGERKGGEREKVREQETDKQLDTHTHTDRFWSEPLEGQRSYSLKWGKLLESWVREEDKEFKFVPISAHVETLDRQEKRGLWISGEGPVWRGTLGSCPI